MRPQEPNQITSHSRNGLSNIRSPWSGARGSDDNVVDTVPVHVARCRNGTATSVLLADAVENEAVGSVQRGSSNESPNGPAMRACVEPARTTRAAAGANVCLFIGVSSGRLCWSSVRQKNPVSKWIAATAGALQQKTPLMCSVRIWQNTIRRSPRGFEHGAKPTGKNEISESPVTNSATLYPDDPELACISDRWPMLPQPIRRAIMALIE